MSLDLENLTTEEQLFADALEASGMPVTEVAIKTELQDIAEESQLEIANTSKYSAFWNFCSEAITKPTQYLTAFLIKNVIPNYYIKTASLPFLKIIAWAYDITWKVAVKLQGNLVFFRINTAQQLLIPAGTVVRTIPINGTIYRMVTLADAVMEIGEETKSVLCEAENAGAGYNLGASYYSIMDSDVPEITSVTNESDYMVLPGSDDETADELRLRLKNHFSAVGDWHIDSKYKAMIAENTGISIDRISFDHSIPRGPASADAYILFDFGVTPTEYLDSINEYISTDGNHGHGDDLEVKALPASTHDVSGIISFKSSVASEERTEIIANIEQFIRCAFRENSEYTVTQTWPYATFSFSMLDKELHTEFPEITGIVWGQDDIVSNLDVPRLGTLTLTEAE